MKKIITTGLMLAVALFGSVALAKGKSGKNAGASDVEVLHWPSNDNFFLVIPMNALSGHLRHGDCLPNGIPQDGTGEDDPAVLAAINKAGADISYVDGCLLPPDPTNDEDSDGVPDEDDLCPGTPSGFPVDENGCVLQQ